MTTATLGQLIEKHGFDVLDHLDRDLEIPVHAGLQAQGDLFIIPADPDRGSRQGAAVPLDGIAVIEAVNGGHEHRLFAGQPGTAFFTRPAPAVRTSGSWSAASPRTSPTLSTPTLASLPGAICCAGSGNKPIRNASVGRLALSGAVMACGPVPEPGRSSCRVILLASPGTG